MATHLADRGPHPTELLADRGPHPDLRYYLDTIHVNFLV